MDLKPLYDATFLIALALFGVVIPIFTLSISLIGHAVERSRQKVAQRRAEAEKELLSEKESLEIKLIESKNKSIIEEVKKIELELDKLKKSRRKFEKDSFAIIKRYDRIKFRESVLIPGFLFLCTMVYSLYAKICNLPGIALLSWIFSLIFVSVGIFKICKSLNVIQEIGLSSDEYQQEKMYEAIYRAFKTHEEDESTIVQIEFEKITKPFKFPKSSEIEIKFNLDLMQGKIAKDTKVLFILSKEFDFPKSQQKWNQDTNFTIPNGISTQHAIGNVRRGVKALDSIIIKTPSQEGKYKMEYDITSEEFHKREIIDIEII